MLLTITSIENASPLELKMWVPLFADLTLVIHFLTLFGSLQLADLAPMVPSILMRQNSESLETMEPVMSLKKKSCSAFPGSLASRVRESDSFFLAKAIEGSETGLMLHQVKKVSDPLDSVCFESSSRMCSIDWFRVISYKNTCRSSEIDSRVETRNLFMLQMVTEGNCIEFWSSIDILKDVGYMR